MKNPFTACLTKCFTPFLHRFKRRDQADSAAMPPDIHSQAEMQHAEYWRVYYERKQAANNASHDLQAMLDLGHARTMQRDLVPGPPLERGTTSW